MMGVEPEIKIQPYPPAREEWIEISMASIGLCVFRVSFRTGGVD